MYINELEPTSICMKPVTLTIGRRFRRFTQFNEVKRQPPQNVRQGLPQGWHRKAARAAFEFFYLFMETSSIHGFNHLTTRKRTFWEYVLWLVFLVLGAAGAVSIGLSTWERYQENPTVISMERDSQEWNTSFPAATICPNYKFDSGKVKAFVDKLKNIDDKAKMIEFLKKLADATYESFLEVPDDPSGAVSPSDYQNITLQVRLQQLKVWYNIKNIALSLVVISGNELDGDLFSQIMDMNSPVYVYIHGPEEIPDCATRKLVLPDKKYKTVDLGETRSLSIRQRKCRFADESNLKLTPVYSYNLCRMECRMNQAYKLCGCVPYFYKPLDNLKVCDPKGMRCLGENEDSLIRLQVPGTSEKKLDCQCLPTCIGINYIIEMQSDMPWFLGTNVKWSLSRYPQMRLKRDVLFGFTDVLVSIGGTAGLFLGCSILSFMEIFYFFTLRLFWYILRERK